MTWHSEDCSIEIWGHSVTSDILKGQLDLESIGVSWAQLEGKALTLSGKKKKRSDPEYCCFCTKKKARDKGEILENL